MTKRSRDPEHVSSVLLRALEGIVEKAVANHEPPSKLCAWCECTHAECTCQDAAISATEAATSSTT